MFRFLAFRLNGRRAIGTIIGGMIILTLLLTALVTMAFVSQQNDQYQQSVKRMAQYDNQRSSENLVFNSIQANTNWNGCSGCNMYNMSLSNLGGVGAKIVRIYINSTVSGSGCQTLCVLNPTLTITQYSFSQAQQFINVGETNHAVLQYLPSTVTLPLGSYSNTILVVTSRGNIFSFRWPIPFQMGGQSQSAFSAGIVKIAYQYSQGLTGGYDSSNEPGPVAAGSGGTGGTGYCHQEPAQAYPAGATYAEKLAVNYQGVTGGVLWFVSPWITQPIFNTAQTNGPAPPGHPTWPSNLTTLYLYVTITNVGISNLTIGAGSIDLTWYSYNWLDANLIGFYMGTSPGTFYQVGSTQKIVPGQSFYAIFKVVSLSLGTSQSTWPPPGTESVMFVGSAALTSATTGSTYIAGVALTSGLWVRYSC